VKAMISKAVLPAVVLTFCLWGSRAARADNYTFSAGNFSRSNIGNVYGATGYDGLTLTGDSGSFSLNPGASVTLPISRVFFNVGYTGSNSAGPTTGTAAFSVTLDGVMQTFNLPFTVDIGNYYDTLTLSSNSLDFNLGRSGSVSLTALQFGPLASGGPTYGTLEGTFATSAVPEPAELTLFGTGLLGIAGLMALFRRGRRSGDPVAVPVSKDTGK